MFNPFSEVADSGSEDAELVQQAKNGDRSALEKLVLRHQAWIYNIAVRMMHHPQDAEDVTQEILIKVLTRLSSFDGRSSFRTWLYRIVVNHVPNSRVLSLTAIQVIPSIPNPETTSALASIQRRRNPRRLAAVSCVSSSVFWFWI